MIFECIFLKPVETNKLKNLLLVCIKKTLENVKFAQFLYEDFLLQFVSLLLVVAFIFNFRYVENILFVVFRIF